MGDCNETLRELEAFLDQELTDGGQAVVHAHLEHCTDCLEAYDFEAEQSSRCCWMWARSSSVSWPSK